MIAEWYEANGRRHPRAWLDHGGACCLAQGKPQVEIESVMEFARFNKEPIAQFTCNPRR